MTNLFKNAWLPSLAMFAPAALYVLAFNPWFVPDQHDDVLYYFGAVSMLGGEGFALGGVPITDWPPVFSASLVAMLAGFGETVWVAKAFVLVTVILGIALALRVAREFGLPNPRLVAALTGLLPVALVTGASVLSEWPYIVASFAFLLALSKLSQTRQWRWAVAAGVLLAIASLTRFLGVFLGVAIVVQAVRFARQRGLGGVGQEILVSLMGAVPWVVWKLRCQALIAAGEAPPGAYDQGGYYLERFSNIEPLTLFSQLESALFSLGKAGEHFTGLELFRWCAAILVGGLLVVGVVVRWREGKLTPADAYVAICLLLLLGDLKKPERYFLPLAPFLIGYLIGGASAIAARYTPDVKKQALRGAAMMWVAWLLLLDGYVLFVGDLENSRGGLSMLANPSVEDYYRGKTLDLYQALRWADGTMPSGEFAASGFHGKYVLAFTGRGFRTLPDDDPQGVVALVAPSGNLPDGWELVRTFGVYSVGRPAAGGDGN